MIDHRSFSHNLCSCEIKAWKKNHAWTEFEPMTSAIPVQCSTNWAFKPTGSWSHCEFVIYPYKQVNYANEYMKVHISEIQRKIWRHDWSSQLYTKNTNMADRCGWQTVNVLIAGWSFLCLSSGRDHCRLCSEARLCSLAMLHRSTQLCERVSVSKNICRETL